MAFTEEYILPQRWHLFSFYESWGANGKYTGSCAPGKLWRLNEIRIHFSVAFLSNQYLIMNISAIKGSAYNTTLYSVNVSGSTDIFLNYTSNPLTFLSDDHLNIVLSMKSGTNVIGLNLIGWAVGN